VAYLLHLEKKIICSPNTYFFMANSHMCREELIKKFKIDPKRIEVIYNGIDSSLFNTVHIKKHRNEFRSQYNLSSNQIVLLFVGNGFGGKNLMTVLSMAKELGSDLGQFKFVIVGRGRIAHFRRKAAELRVEKQFLFLGYQSDVHKFYQAADGLIHPALYDPCSNACLEALACGLPVLCTKTNGASHWIENGKNGFVVDDPRDAQSFANHAKVFLDTNTRERMRHAAPKTVSTLTDENHDQALVDLLEKAFTHKRRVDRLPLELVFYGTH